MLRSQIELTDAAAKGYPQSVPSKGRALAWQDWIDWRGPLQPVAAIKDRNMDRQDKQDRLVLHPVHPVDRCKTRIEGSTWMADEGS